MHPSLFETSNQLWIFLFTAYGGVVLGVLYDLLAIIRMTLHSRGVAVVFFDVLYWLLATVLCFAVLYYACNGEFLYYHALGFALGAAIWFLGPGRGVRWLYHAVMRGFRFLWGKFRGTGVYRFLFR